MPRKIKAILMLGLLLPALALAQTDLGGNLVEVISVDLVQYMVTFRLFTNRRLGQFKYVTCWVDDNSNITKDGQLMGLAQLKEGDWIVAGESVGSSGSSSCGDVQVITDEKIINEKGRRKY